MNLESILFFFFNKALIDRYPFFTLSLKNWGASEIKIPNNASQFAIMLKSIKISRHNKKENIYGRAVEKTIVRKRARKQSFFNETLIKS